MGYILHIDTSGDVGTVAISRHGVLLVRIDSKESRNHAAVINTMVVEACDSIQIALGNLVAIAVCAGPGSYTGLRIAMATAKGLCYALGLPLIADDRLTILSGDFISRNHISENEHVAAVLLARENEYFISIRNGNNMSIVPPSHIEETNLAYLLRKSESLHIITDMPKELFYKLSINFSSFTEDISIDYNYWAQVAEKKAQCHEYVDFMTATPLYLKQVFTRK